jgi:hypothetical protein
MASTSGKEFDGNPQGVSALAGAQPARLRAGYEPSEPSHTAGSTSFAGILLIVGGLWSFITGLSILARKSYFTSLPGYSSAAHHYVFEWNLTGWGWTNLIMGVSVVAAGGCVLLGQAWARWAGVVLAVISSVISFLLIPFYSFWPLLVIAVNVFIVWALATARRRHDF